jgi:hypothetical protein
MLTGLCTALEGDFRPPITVQRPYAGFQSDLGADHLPATGLLPGDTYQSLATRRVRQARAWVLEEIHNARHTGPVACRGDCTEEVSVALRALRYWQRRLILAPVHDAMRERHRLQFVHEITRRESVTALLAAE